MLDREGLRHVLIRAWSHISNPEKWIKGKLNDVDGGQCMIGAINTAATELAGNHFGKFHRDQYAALKILSTAIMLKTQGSKLSGSHIPIAAEHKLPHDANVIADFNDHRDTDHGDVGLAFQEALSVIDRL